MRFLILLFLCFHAQAQFSSSTTTKVDVIKNNATTDVTLSPSGDVVLTPSTADTLIYADANKKLKSTSYSPDDVITQDPITNEVLINGYLNLVSTTQGSVSCPVMTETQRNSIITPATGECVFNSSSQSLNVYDGATWKSAGGGISQWVTAFNYSIDDIVVYVGEIYQALTAHTSGTFTTDLANGEWVKIADTIQARGLQDSSSTTFETIATHNKQLTSIGSTTALIETRNRNLLSNSSFEHATYDTDWTCTGAATESRETTILVDGKASLKSVTSAQSFDCSQDSTLYASQFSGVQGVASVWVDTTDSTVQICARQAGTDTDCVTAIPDGLWREYVIPFVLGGTSNGIKIKGTSGTGTTYIDDAYVGVMPATMMPEISQAQLIGTLTYAGAVNCEWTLTNTAFTNFSLDADCSTPTVTGLLIAPSTKIPAFVLPAGSQAGSYRIVARAGFGGGGSGGRNHYFRFSDGTNVTTSGIIFQSNSIPLQSEISGVISYSGALTSNTTIQIQGAASSGAADIDASIATNSSLTFEVYYYPPKSKIYSQQCTSSLDCENVFSAKVSSTGVVSGENLDFINGNCVVTDTSLYTCTFNTNIFTVAPNCTMSPNTSTGSAVGRVSSSSSTNVVTRTFVAGTGNTALNHDIICQKSPPDFKEKNVITGTFANVVTAPNIAKPKTCYYAFGGASATLASPTECAASPCIEVYDSCSAGTAPTRSGTGQYADLTIANSTWKASSFLDCRCEAYDTTANTIRECVVLFQTGDQTWMTNSSGGAVLNFYTFSEGGASSDTYIKTTCTADAP